MEIKKNNKEFILPHLKAGEEVIGYLAVTKNPTIFEQIIKGFFAISFTAYVVTTMHSAWWVFLAILLLGFFQIILGMSAPKAYTLGVTNLGIHRASASSLIPWLGKSDSYSFYHYEDIAHITLKKARIFSSILDLQFRDGKIVSYAIGIYPGSIAKTIDYLLSRIAK